jgi:hypothetical protein
LKRKIEESMDKSFFPLLSVCGVYSLSREIDIYIGFKKDRVLL